MEHPVYGDDNVDNLPPLDKGFYRFLDSLNEKVEKDLSEARLKLDQIDMQVRDLLARLDALEAKSADIQTEIEALHESN